MQSVSNWPNAQFPLIFEIYREALDIVISLKCKIKKLNISSETVNSADPEQVTSHIVAKSPNSALCVVPSACQKTPHERAH